MSKVERMIRLFDEECKLYKEIDRAMPWMTPIAYKRKQDSLKSKLEKNQERQRLLADKMTFEEKEDLYSQTEINLNDV